FENYPSINDVEKFKTKMLQINEELLPELEEGVYYESEIIGSTVLNEAGQEIGKLKEILFLPANDVWVVKRPGKKDLLLPYIESVVLDVNTDSKEITVHVLEGLDDNDN